VTVMSHSRSGNRLTGMKTTPPTSDLTLGEMLEEVMNLGVGLGVGLLPLLLLAVPGIILFVVLPAIVLLAPVVLLAAAGALIAGPPYLLVRGLRRLHALQPDVVLRQRRGCSV